MDRLLHRIRLMLAMVMILTSLRAVSQSSPDYHLQMFDFSYGIKPGIILGLSKDRDGFLWVLYARSVQRFDGRQVKTYTFDSGLHSILCDHYNNIWVNSNDSVYRYDPVIDAFDPVGIEARDSSFYLGPVFHTPDGKLRVLTSRSFLVWEESTASFVESAEPIPVRGPYVARSMAHSGYSIFFGANRQIFRYNLLNHELDSLPSHSLRMLYPISQDSVMLSSWDLQSFWFDFKHNKVDTAVLPDHLTEDRKLAWSVRGITPYAPFRYLITSLDGLFSYHQKDHTFEKIRLYYKGQPVFATDFSNTSLLDEDGYVWLGSIDGIGRFALYGQTFGLMRVKNLHDQLPSGVDNIRSIAHDEQGRLWLATGNGFVRWDRKKEERKMYFHKEGSTDQLAFPSTRGLVYDGRYIILGPSDLGVWLFDPRTERYKRPYYASEDVKAKSERDFFDHITTLRSGDHLFLGRDHLYLLDGATYKLDVLHLPFSRENNNAAYQGDQGEIWVTTAKGMYYMEEDFSGIESVDFKGGKHFVYAGYALPNRQLLFSTQDGVFLAQHDGDKIEITKFNAPFGKSLVTSLIRDHNGVIWAASDQGIFRYDPNTSRINLFDYSDNVQGFGFNSNSWCIDDSGTIYVGGTNGLNYFIPEQVTTGQVPLNLFIQRVTGSKGNVYPVHSNPRVKWMRRALEIEYVCPYFNNPDKLMYRYRLDGLDTEWNFAGNSNRIRFASLPPGKYTLHLEASINNTDWVPSRNTFSFQILPPFWRTAWFYGLCIVCIGFLLYALERRRNLRILEKQEELEAEQAITYFSTRMVEEKSVDEMLWDVARNCIGRLQFEDCVIYRLDPVRNVMYQVAAYGPKSSESDRIVEPMEISVGTGIVGSVAQSGLAEIIQDTRLDPRYIEDDARRLSEIAVPIVSGGEVIGVIDSEHSKKAFFTQRHLTILQTIASLCAAKMVKAKAEEEMRAAERMLMETKQQMADIEMQALRAQMNPHFIFNCLNSINRYIVKSDQATASLYLTRFAKLIRLILDNSNSKSVTLTNELEALRLYIEMESIRFEKKFTWEISIAPDIMPDHIYVPPLIIQPFVENAIWHGLLHKEEEGHLRIQMYAPEDKLLECSIEDDGVGRARSRELKSKSVHQSKSLGMKLTESRLALLNKHANWNAAVQIHDLVDPEGQAAGTKVILRIPLDD